MSEPSSTGTEQQQLLDALRSALADEIGATDRDDLVVVRSGIRRRSRLFFVGVGDPDARWVVKQPNTGSQQADLSAPLPADRQFVALQRLRRQLRSNAGDLSTPRPVAELPELGAYVMEYVPGPTVAAM